MFVFILLVIVLLILVTVAQGKKPAKRFQSVAVEGTLTHQDKERKYYYYVPPSVSKEQQVPLVFILHGGKQKNIDRLAGKRNEFHDLADNDQTIIVYPEAIDAHWNDGINNPKFDSTIDDVGFVRAVISEIRQSYTIDPKRIYATGVSNGGFFAFRLGCEAADLFAAIGPVAATMIPDIINQDHDEPVSVINFLGTADKFVPYEGGSGTKDDITVTLLSAADTLKYWRERNRCNPEAIARERFADDANEEEIPVEHVAYTSCARGTSVEQYALIGGGHVWPGSKINLPQWLVGKNTTLVDASTTIWEFFKQHPKPL